MEQLQNTIKEAFGELRQTLKNEVRGMSIV